MQPFVAETGKEGPTNGGSIICGRFGSPFPIGHESTIDGVSIAPRDYERGVFFKDLADIMVLQVQKHLEES